MTTAYAADHLVDATDVYDVLLGMADETAERRNDATDKIMALFAPVVERLKAAENVCVMIGWTGTTAGPEESDRAKAAAVLWHAWSKNPGVSTEPGDHPHLNDRVITRLAQTRDEAREAALAKIAEAHA